MSRTSGSTPRPFPIRSLEKALVIIQAIVDKNASQEMDRLLVADAIGRTPSSSEFRRLLSCSRQYGLTEGTEKADYIAPTELGLRIAKPRSPDERAKSLVEACLKPEFIGKILRHFNKNKLPDESFFKNSLERTFNVDPSHSKELVQVLIANAAYCGIVQNISGAQYIRIDDPLPVDTPSTDGDGLPDESPVIDLNAIRDQQDDVSSAGVKASGEPGKIFVAHGKKLKPVEGLKKVLDQFKIPYKVAVDEAHAGRPISLKVGQLMDECSAGIFVFTKDECFLRKTETGDLEEVWRPSENVVYELGAASKLWERRIIILREEGVNFPSDFKDLGYITFYGDDLANKALDLLKELVELELVRVQAA